MRTIARYALAVAVGLGAGGAAAFLAGDVVDPVRTWLAAGLNAVVWTGSVALYVPVYERFDGAPANGDDIGTYESMKWSGLAGVTASVGVTGVPMLLVDAVPGGLVAAVGMLAFGLVLLAMAIGMRAVAARSESDRGDSVASSESEPDGHPAAD